jgi:ATP-binding cassette, subfamily C, bacterial LapB
MTNNDKNDAVDPLLDCLVMVARHHGHTTSRAVLSAGLPLHEGKLSPDLMVRAAQRASLALRILNQAIDSIDNLVLPAILFLKNQGACVLQSVEASTGRYTILVPEVAGGAVTLGKTDLEARYSGTLALVAPQLRFDARSPSLRTPRSEHWFWSAILRQRYTYHDVILGALLVNLFAIGMPIFAMNVYDRVVPNNAVETLWALALGITLLLGADLALRRLRSKLVDQASARVDIEISASLMEQLLGMRYGDRPLSTGSFASNIRAFEQVRDLIASSTVIALVDLPFVILFIVCIAWISPWLALPALLMFLCIVVFGYVMQERMHVLSESTFKGNCLRNALLVESLIGLETIKAQHAEGLFQSRWEQTTRYIAKCGVQMRELSTLAISGAHWLQQMTSVTVVIAGVYLIVDKQLTLGGLIACYMLTSRALAPAAQIVGLLLQYQNARTALASLDAFMEKPRDRDAGKVYVEHTIADGSIEFRDVSFAYPGREEKVLHNISFRINPGERVAILGRVGSGKSTLQRLITNLYTPASGMVLIDGVDVRQMDPAVTRHSVGFVSQDVMLFYGTLRENIALGKPYVEDAAILEAARIAGLTEFISAHPEGLAMAVGERGELLSGGQRQAIGIARAVLHHAPILLMDEPTSAMDYSTEAAVSASLAKFCAGRTLLIATHRSTLLTLCDRIIVLDAGRIVADGPRESVMGALASGKITKASP